jgi:hypothetical protein
MTMVKRGRETNARGAPLNLFPGVLRDAAIKREWADAIYAQRRLSDEIIPVR